MQFSASFIIAMVAAFAQPSLQSGRAYKCSVQSNSDGSRAFAIAGEPWYRAKPVATLCYDMRKALAGPCHVSVGDVPCGNGGGSFVLTFNSRYCSGTDLSIAWESVTQLKIRC